MVGVENVPLSLISRRGSYSMNRLEFTPPVLLALVAGAHAQTRKIMTCPQLSTDSGVSGKHNATAKIHFCHALLANGSKAFGLKYL